MNKKPIIPVDYFMGSAGDLVTGWNTYGKSMTGIFHISDDFGFHVIDDDKILFEVIYIQRL